jgi:hypothetical protein
VTLPQLNNRILHGIQRAVEVFDVAVALKQAKTLTRIESGTSCSSVPRMPPAEWLLTELKLNNCILGG